MSARPAPKKADTDIRAIAGHSKFAEPQRSCKESDKGGSAAKSLKQAARKLPGR
jgi:hypothetical protein